MSIFLWLKGKGKKRLILYYVVSINYFEIISLLQFLWFVSTRFIYENAMSYNGLRVLNTGYTGRWWVGCQSTVAAWDHAHVMTSRSSSPVDWDRVNHAQCRRYDGPEVWCRSRVASVSSSGQRTRDDVMVIPRSPISIVSASFEAGVKLKLHLQFLISKATRSDNPVSLRSLHPVCIQHKITVT